MGREEYWKNGDSASRKVGKKDSFPWDELKSLVKQQIVTYTSEPKVIQANGFNLKSQLQIFVFPESLESMAIQLGSAIWDEGVSMATPARYTNILKDEKNGTVTVERFSAWAGPIHFEADT